jgi:hypothetical protein
MNTYEDESYLEIGMTPPLVYSNEDEVYLEIGMEPPVVLQGV